MRVARGKRRALQGASSRVKASQEVVQAAGIMYDICMGTKLVIRSTENPGRIQLD